MSGPITPDEFWPGVGRWVGMVAIDGKASGRTGRKTKRHASPLLASATKRELIDFVALPAAELLMTIGLPSQERTGTC